MALNSRSGTTGSLMVQSRAEPQKHCRFLNPRFVCLFSSRSEMSMASLRYSIDPFVFC